MKTLKITIVASLAATLAWWPFRFPQRLWPEHPVFADFLLTLALIALLQFAWAGSKSTAQRKETPPPAPLKKTPAEKNTK